MKKVIVSLMALVILASSAQAGEFVGSIAGTSYINKISDTHNYDPMETIVEPATATEDAVIHTTWTTDNTQYSTRSNGIIGSLGYGLYSNEQIFMALSAYYSYEKYQQAPTSRVVGISIDTQIPLTSTYSFVFKPFYGKGKENSTNFDEFGVGLGINTKLTPNTSLNVLLNTRFHSYDHTYQYLGESLLDIKEHSKKSIGLSIGLNFNL